MELSVIFLGLFLFSIVIFIYFNRNKKVKYSRPFKDLIEFYKSEYDNSYGDILYIKGNVTKDLDKKFKKFVKDCIQNPRDLITTLINLDDVLDGLNNYEINHKKFGTTCFIFVDLK